MNLLKYIGETTFYEKKSTLEEHKPKSWLKSVSAFANTNGGKIFFGISNDDKLIGIKNYKEDSEKISEVIKTKLDPIPKFDLEIIEESNKYFITLTIHEGLETPYYFVNSSTRTAYIRIGNESVAANSTQLKNLVLKGTNKSFDACETNISKDRASFTKLKSIYYQQTKTDFTDNDLLSFGLINENNSLTNAGALLADERLIYQSRIFCTKWNGLDKTNGRLEAIDDKEFEGGLLHLLQCGEDFIKSNSKKMWKKSENQRIEYPDYPERAIQEALVNALIHRDYSEIGSEIHIDMYDDRLEIYSPGGMIDGSLIQNHDPYTIASKRRNPIIADLFGRMNYMDRRGSGLKKIIELYTIQENYTEYLKPIFSSTHSSFFIKLHNLNYENKNKTAIKNGDKIAISSDKIAISSDKVAINKNNTAINNSDKIETENYTQESIIIKFAKDKETFKTTDIEKLLKVKAARARRILSKLVTEGLLEAIGQNRNRMYRLKSENLDKSN